MYVCVILLEFAKDRPTRDQVRFLFVRRLSLRRRITYRGGQQENQSVYPAGYSTCLYLNLFSVDLRRVETCCFSWELPKLSLVYCLGDPQARPVNKRNSCYLTILHTE